MKKLTRVLFWLWRVKQRIVTLLGGKTVGARALVLRNSNRIYSLNNSINSNNSGRNNSNYNNHHNSNDDENAEILLVKHTYCPGWCSIGGAVDKGETPIESLQRELMEEVGVSLLQAPELMGIYYSNSEKRDDYVVMYVVRHFNENDSNSDEIAEKRWFRLNDLPLDITAATLRRIEEYRGIRVLTEGW